MKYKFTEENDVVSLYVNKLKFTGKEGLMDLIKFRHKLIRRINLTFMILDGFNNTNYKGDIQVLFSNELDSIIKEFNIRLGTII